MKHTVSTMENIREKIKSYVEREFLLEFNTPKECMKYFNAYDYQDFKTIKEMKEYQGKYGFSFNGKWYHINVEDALDILDDLETMPQ